MPRLLRWPSEPPALRWPSVPPALRWRAISPVLRWRSIMPPGLSIRAGTAILGGQVLRPGHAALAGLTHRWNRRAIVVSTGLHCAALLLFTMPLWTESVSQFARGVIGGDAAVLQASNDGSLAASSVAVDPQAENHPASRTRLRVIYRTSERPPERPPERRTPAAPAGLAAASVPEPGQPESGSEPADAIDAPESAEIAAAPETASSEVISLSGPERAEADDVSGSAPAVWAAVNEAAPAERVDVLPNERADALPTERAPALPTERSVPGGNALQDAAINKPSAGEGGAAAAPERVTTLAKTGAPERPVASATEPLGEALALAHAHEAGEQAPTHEAVGSSATAAAQVAERSGPRPPLVLPSDPASGSPSKLPGKAGAMTAAGSAPGLPAEATLPSPSSLQSGTPAARPFEPRAVPTERQQRLAAELEELSERIKDYQAREEKARREAEQAQRWSQGGEGEGALPLPRKSAPPASASAESITQARLAVALTPFQTSHRYRMYYGDRKDDAVVALVRLDVEVDGEHYRMRSEARPQGLAAALFQGVFTQESRGRISPWGYRPEQYEEQRGSRGTRWAQMDWAAGEVRLPDGERQPIAPGVQDRLSIAWQLSALARHQLARLQSSEGIQIPLLLSRHVELNRFHGREVSEQELDGQRLRLLKVEREPRKGKRDARVEVWLDTERDMLPVRVRIADDRGRVIDQVIVFNAS